MTARLLEHALGVSWVVREPQQRASHALRADGRVWLVDPVADEPALERAAGLGRPAAVLQLLDRHERDCALVAARLAVPHLRVPDAVPDSPFEAIRAVRVPGWRETALWWPGARALVVAEVVGTAPYYALDAAPAGLHPLLRPLPPAALRDHAPEHLLVGHGAPLHGPAAAEGVRQAHARARRDLPRLARFLLRTARSARQRWQ